MNRRNPWFRSDQDASAIPARCLLLAVLACALLACGAGGASGAPAAASPPVPAARSPLPAAPSPVTPVPAVPTGPNGLAEMTRVPVPGTASPSGAILADPAGGAVYLARSGAGVVVIDTATRAVARTLARVADPRGIAADGRFVYLTSDRPAEITVVSKDRWSVVGAVPTRDAAPGDVWADAARDRLYVLDQARPAVEVYTAGPDPTFRAEIALPPGARGDPGAAALDPGHDALDVPDGAAIARVDLGGGQVSAERVPLAGAATLTALLYDARADALWATTTDRQVVVLDAASFRTLATLPGPAGQRLAIDPALRFVYAFGGAAFWAYSTNWLVPWSRVDVGPPDVAAGAVDPATHDLYVDARGAGDVEVYQWLNAGGGSGASGGAAPAPGAGTPGATPAAAPRLIPIVSPAPAGNGTGAGPANPSPTSRGSSSAATGGAASETTAVPGASGASVAPTPVPPPTSAPIAAPTSSLPGTTSGSAAGGPVEAPTAASSGIAVPTAGPAIANPAPPPAGASAPSGASGAGSPGAVGPEATPANP